MVVDHRDPQVAAAVAAAGVEPVVAETMMDGAGAAAALAEAVCRALGLDRPPAAAA